MLLSADQNGVDDEEMITLLEDGDHLHESAHRRRHKRTCCAYAAEIAGATMLLAIVASSFEEHGETCKMHHFKQQHMQIPALEAHGLLSLQWTTGFTVTLV